MNKQYIEKPVLIDEMICQNEPDRKAKVAEHDCNDVYRLNCGCLYQEYFVAQGKPGFEYLEHSNCENA